MTRNEWNALVVETHRRAQEDVGGAFLYLRNGTFPGQAAPDGWLEAESALIDLYREIRTAKKAGDVERVRELADDRDGLFEILAELLGVE